MRVLHHRPLSPVCRAMRLALAEKGLEFELSEEPAGAPQGDSLASDPAGEAPVLDEDDGGAVRGAWALIEYLEETYPQAALWPRSPAARAECRRLADRFCARFDAEVSRVLLHEQVTKRLLRLGEPDSQAIRAARDRLGGHLGYIGALFERRRWLGGEAMSYADLAAAAQLSVVDYLGGVSWSVAEQARDWYALMKSRPSFRPLLEERVPGLPAPPHYDDLDF